ncbi:MAG: sigma-70 family RNA polymerase sigma factor [Acidaminococcaceae bacterium]|jgi:RNA polymerase sigma-70 factor (ECF subfamily)|nr:sigma-70 family RNA polymerase sigma factor [Acidaminococcaceae bacterium]
MEAVKDPDSRRDQTIERLITQHQTSLLRLCYVQLQDQALAEDAVQETFLKAYKGFDSFRGDSSEKTWLTRIAVNTCRDFQRGGWFKHTDRRVTPDMLPVGTVQPDTEDLDLSLAVMKLPRKMREAILLYYYQDMSTEEIAETLGIAQSSVSNRLRRGREKLRKLLEGRDQDA